MNKTLDWPMFIIFCILLVFKLWEDSISWWWVFSPYLIMAGITLLAVIFAAIKPTKPEESRLEKWAREQQERKQALKDRRDEYGKKS